MVEDQNRRLPFSQRTGLAPIPPQLQLGEVSNELRRLLWYAVHKDFETCERHGVEYLYLEGHWKIITRDMFVRIFKRMPDDYRSGSYEHEKSMKTIFTRGNIGEIFDFVEFLLSHRQVGTSLRNEIAGAFVEARAAYRVIDGTTIIAVGSEEQAEAMERAIADAEHASAVGARKHIVEAGKAVARGDWSGSVRESIHAVESVAVHLAADRETLGSALSALESQGHLHGALKRTLSSLYGYTSDQKGVRHALVFEDKAKVDETDALFMLGACSSFVSYLISRGTSAGLLTQSQ